MLNEYSHQYEPDGYRHRNSCWHVIDKRRKCDCRTFAADVRKMVEKMLPELERILVEKCRASENGFGEQR